MGSATFECVSHRVQARKEQTESVFIPPKWTRKMTIEDPAPHRVPKMDYANENFWYLELGEGNDAIRETEICGMNCWQRRWACGTGSKKRPGEPGKAQILAHKLAVPYVYERDNAGAARHSQKHPGYGKCPLICFECLLILGNL